jgi:uncharacterized SAM-binding protein YcdF (DUF218 family)
MAAGLAASIRPFVSPDREKLTRSDAVVVLSGGDYGERLAQGLALVRTGVAPTLVLDGEADLQEAQRLCTASVSFEVVCLRPVPDSTRAEARAAGRLAAARGWHHLVVATSTAHVTRAHLLFSRCVKGDVQAVGAQPPYGLRTRVKAIAHEWLGTLYALTVKRQC